MAIVPQGGNTGLVGGSVPLDGELVLSLTRLAQLDDVDTTASQVTARRRRADRGAADDRRRSRPRVRGRPRQPRHRDRRRHHRHERGRPACAPVRRHATPGRRHRGRARRRLGGVAPVGPGARQHRLPPPVAARGQRGHARHRHRVRGCGSSPLRPITPWRCSRSRRPADAVASIAALQSSCATVEAIELFLPSGLALVCRGDGRATTVPDLAAHGAYLLVEAADRRDTASDLAESVASLERVVDVAVAVDAPASRRAVGRTASSTPRRSTASARRTSSTSRCRSACSRSSSTRCRRSSPARPPPPARGCSVTPATATCTSTSRASTPTTSASTSAVLRYTAALGGSISAEHGIGRAKQRWLAPQPQRQRARRLPCDQARARSRRGSSTRACSWADSHVSPASGSMSCSVISSTYRTSGSHASRRVSGVFCGTGRGTMHRHR